MFCQHCLYDLRESNGACPECGRTFDPSDPNTFKATTRRLPQPEGIVSFLSMTLMTVYMSMATTRPRSQLARRLDLPDMDYIEGWSPALGLLALTLLFGFSSMKRERGISSKLATFAVVITWGMTTILILAALVRWLA